MKNDERGFDSLPDRVLAALFEGSNTLAPGSWLLPSIISAQSQGATLALSILLLPSRLEGRIISDGRPYRGRSNRPPLPPVKMSRVTAIEVQERKRDS